MPASTGDVGGRFGQGLGGSGISDRARKAVTTAAEMPVGMRVGKALGKTPAEGLEAGGVQS
jgi:hypothetical protein